MFALGNYDCTVFTIDAEFELGVHSTTNIGISLSSEDLAYVIYTSGSTGSPKGVMVEHGGVRNTILSQISGFNLGEDRIGLQFASFSFDASVWEMFIILLSGGKLYVASETERKDVSLLEHSIVRHKINIATFSPSHLQLLDISKLTGIKTLITAGEAANYDKVKEYLELSGGIYYNAYGPTETSICGTIYRLEELSGLSSQRVLSIGKPIGNTSIYILDSALHLCAKGVVGELCIGGDGLARGYLNRADLTCEKFVPNPFVEGDRIYRTGDLARWLPDGNIEFIGRNDDQVKIRGYRIELGEIEHVLESQAFINQAVVLAKEAETGEAVIVCYIVSDSDLNIEVVRDVLSKSLPSYMLPSHYVQLSEMPLTSNGKVDKKSLLSMEVEGLVSGVEYLAPRSEMEIEMVRIWEDLLEKEKVGLRDDFFVLGGHSLKAIRLINEYHKLFDVRVELKDVFASSTIEGQSQLLASRVKKEYKDIVRLPVQDSYSISDAQRRLWVLSQFEDGSKAYHIPSHFDLKANASDISNLKLAIHCVIERHEILRTVFRENAEEEVRQWILTPETLDFKIEELDFSGYDDASSSSNALLDYISADNSKAFDLESGPLLRVSIIRLWDEHYVFYYNMHHIISDGWSMDVLSKEVLHYYECYKSDLPSALPALRIQYKDYASWQLGELSNSSSELDRLY